MIKDPTALQILDSQIEPVINELGYSGYFLHMENEKHGAHIVTKMSKNELARMVLRVILEYDLHDAMDRILGVENE